MHTLKKGILLGLGIADMNKKQIKDFVNGLYKKGYINKSEAEELAETILNKVKKANEKLESRIENYVRNMIKKEELATLEHIDYLEKRIELLEDEVDRLILERDIENMDDEELEEFLKEIGVNPEDFYDEDEKEKEDAVLEDFDDDFIDDLLSLDDEDLEELFKEEEKTDKGLGKKVEIKEKKKTTTKKSKSTTKKKTTKKKTTKKSTTKSKKTTTKKKTTSSKKKTTSKKKSTSKKTTTKKTKTTKKKTTTKKKSTKKESKSAS